MANPSTTPGRQSGATPPSGAGATTTSTTTTPATSPRRQSGASAIRGDHPRGLKWLWWLLLLLLALIIAGIILGLVLSHKSTTNGGTVKVANTDLVGSEAPSTKGQLDQYGGQPVTGNQAHITRLAGTPAPGDNGQVVDDDERIFVGSDAHEVLVLIGDGSTELPQAIPPGHRISFNGTLKPYNGDPASIGLDPKYSSQVAKAGYYIQADPASVRLQA